jgi:hypothetical protein
MASYSITTDAWMMNALIAALKLLPLVFLAWQRALPAQVDDSRKSGEYMGQLSTRLREDNMQLQVGPNPFTERPRAASMQQLLPASNVCYEGGASFCALEGPGMQ